MNIKVVGMGCENCNALYINTKKAIENIGISVELEKVEDLVEIVKLDVMEAPTLIIDGEKEIAGYVANVSEIEKTIQKHLK